MNSVRGLVFLIWMYGIMLVLGILFLPALLLPVSMARFPVDIWIKLVFWGLRVTAGITVEIKGREFLPQGGVLIASKHQSMFDVLIPWQLFVFPALILKQELSWLPIFGWYALKLRNVAIDRSGGANSLRKMLRQSAELASSNRQILIFPEGTRVNPGERAAYKPGVAALYKEMGVPCVPIALNSGVCWPARGIRFNPGQITVQILPQIDPGLDRRSFMTELETKIETATDDLMKNTRPHK